MSRFLGPIHHWLYNKINLLEDIEKGIIEALVDESEQMAVKADLTGAFGPYLNHAPLDALIDQDNIHGWLQGKIQVAERRQSQLISRLAGAKGDAVYDEISAVYARFGKEHGQAVPEAQASTPEEIFKNLDNFLLEGMPCDRVNAVTENTPEKLAWEKDRCVHAESWNAGGTAVDHYYGFREAFSKAFVEGANPDFTYKFELKNGRQYHMIVKK